MVGPEGKSRSREAKRGIPGDPRGLTLGVVTLGPVVTGSRLTKDEVVRTEDLSVGPGPGTALVMTIITNVSVPDTVHCTRLKVNQDSPGNIPGGANLKEKEQKEHTWLQKPHCSRHRCAPAGGRKCPGNFTMQILLQ